MRGGTAHRAYSVIVFVVLASLDNVAIGLVPPLYGSIGDALGVGEGHIALATTIMFLISAVASVRFAVVSDLISPRRRGLVMSFWGLSQGVGTLAGTLVGGLLGHADWRRPFLVVSIAGGIATVAYLLTYDVPRGDSQPELAGIDYEERLHINHLPKILGRRTNVWLIMQGLTAQIAFGSLVWLPVLFRARAEDQGYSTGTAVLVGSVFATPLQTGGALS